MQTKTSSRTNQTTAALPDIMTADSTIYDTNNRYYFFDSQTQKVRESTGLRRVEESLCAFGLRVVPINRLRLDRLAALADGQTFFKSEISRLEKQITDYEREKSNQDQPLSLINHKGEINA